MSEELVGKLNAWKANLDRDLNPMQKLLNVHWNDALDKAISIIREHYAEAALTPPQANLGDLGGFFMGPGSTPVKDAEGKYYLKGLTKAQFNSALAAIAESKGEQE